MARVKVVMPQMGESIAEGTILKWHKKVGDSVKKDETILEISTDKVDSEIPSPAAGVLAEILVEEQQTVPVQTVIAYLDAEGSEAAPPTERKHERPEPENSGPVREAPRESGSDRSTPSDIRPPAVPAKEKPSPSGGRFYSPLVLNIARTEGIGMEELEQIPGTGDGGRVRKSDIFSYVKGKKEGAVVPPAVARDRVSSPAGAGTKPVEVPELKMKYPSPDHEILRMSNVVQKMAAHMVRSIQTSPHEAADHEVDMTTVVDHRKANSAEFEKREGFKLTYTPYIVEAVLNAIKKYPLINSSVEGDKIIRKNYVNLGIAVASDNGLIVPVLKNAEEKNFTGIARGINDLAVRTRAKRLAPDDIQGGTFTISNFGVFGTLIGTPIINQPQVAILGTGAIKKRVVVINDAIAIRSMAFFTLSFDHRIVDGALGGMFLEEIVKNLESYDASIPF